MPPRKSVRRNKPSSTKASTPVDSHELPAPKAKTETELANDLKVKETVVQGEVSGDFPSESMAKVEVNEDGVVKEDLPSGSEAVDEGKQVETKIIEEKEDSQESEDVDDEEDVDEEDVDEEDPEEEVGNDEDGLQLENNAEITSAQEEIVAVPAVEFKQLNDSNNVVHDSDIKKSPCKNDDLFVVNNEDINDTTEMVSIQDDSMVNLDDDDDDDSEEDDADSEGNQDQVPSFVVQDSSPANKKEKGVEIYVGKLDKNAVEEDLVNVFQQFGELKSTRIVRKPNTNRSKGFGFVRFASVDQANRALSELKDGVEVRGKRVVISASEDNDTLYLGNICKTWNKEQVLQQLKEYGLENFEVLRLPEDPKLEGKNKGFAFLEFSTHSDAVEAFKRLKKPDVVFGRDISAKVAFAETSKHSADEDLSHVNKVHLEGLTEDWTEEKVKDICKNYGEVLKINLRPNTRGKRKDFGFVTFNSSESALACVEGINNTAIGVEAKIKASIAKPQQKVLIKKQGSRGGFKVEKQSENSNKKSQLKSSKMKGVLNTQQTKINKNHPLKNKPQQKGSVKKDAESSKMKGDNDSKNRNRKRKASFEQKSNARDLGTPKKPKNVGQNQSQGQNSQPVSKAGSNKRKKAPGNEAREDRGNRNAQGKKPFKKQKGNMHGRERDNYRKPKSDNTHTRRGHNDYRNSTQYIDTYAPKYAASGSNAYHVPSDRRYKEMEPHAGYIEPVAYSGYGQPVVRTHSQHQTVYHSQSQGQLYPSYLDRPVVSQPHRGYIEAQPYRDYRPSAVVHVAARDAYDSGHARVIRHDDRGAGGLTYVGGPPHSAPQVPEHTSYYQGGGSYGGGAYGSRGAYY